MACVYLPKRTQYILRSLTCLARSRSRLSARTIAAREQIPASFLAKILYQLTWHGLVSSRRGPGGGFVLTRAPAEIRVKQVLEIFQAPTLSSGEEKSDNGFARIWEKIWAPTLQALETLTLADLVDSEPATASVPRGIPQVPLRKSNTQSPTGRRRTQSL